jgi:hypothetical protein
MSKLKKVFIGDGSNQDEHNPEMIKRTPGSIKESKA